MDAERRASAADAKAKKEQTTRRALASALKVERLGHEQAKAELTTVRRRAESLAAQVRTSRCSGLLSIW
jgi:hypothetical protein